MEWFLDLKWSQFHFQLMWMNFFSLPSFNLQNLKIQRKYLLNLNLSLCLEASNPNDCIFSVPIFENAILPKNPCNIDLNYINPSQYFQIIIKIMSGRNRWLYENSFWKKKKSLEKE